MGTLPPGWSLNWKNRVQILPGLVFGKLLLAPTFCGRTGNFREVYFCSYVADLTRQVIWESMRETLRQPLSLQCLRAWWLSLSSGVQCTYVSFSVTKSAALYFNRIECSLHSSTVPSHFLWGTAMSPAMPMSCEEDDVCHLGKETVTSPWVVLLTLSPCFNILDGSTSSTRDSK